VKRGRLFEYLVRVGARAKWISDASRVYPQYAG